MAVKTFAAIDVGSFELSMKIFEFSGKSQGRVIEHIRQREIGRASCRERVWHSV